ncbi:MAG: helix-turn-helix transcriptional regulator [Saprospiraceae bacterium]|jgi:AraC-like DNA-binding protein|nr:helix-turn-helix transcriptional regulator [Saprospiraceae bacterium]
MSNIFYVIGASQGFLLSVFLLLNKDRKMHLPLIIMVFLASFQLLSEYLYASEQIVHIPHLIYLSLPTNTLCGVLLYLFIRNVYNSGPSYRRSDILLFIPFLLSVAYFFSTYTLNAEEKMALLKEHQQLGILNHEYLFEWVFEIVSNLPFLIAAYVLLKKYEENIKNDYINTGYPLARVLLPIFIGLYFFETAIIILGFMGIGWEELTYSVFFLTTCIIYLIGYEVLVHRNNKNIQHEKTLESKESLPIDGTKYNKNILTEDRKQAIAKQIIKCMEDDKMYQNPELRLINLAQHVEEHPNTVSQVINDVFKQNFYDYVNHYRIEEAKRLLKADEFQNYSIISIGEIVGFNSKSTFYSAFKKSTNCTPLQYQNLQNH